MTRMKCRFNDVGLWIIWRSFYDALLIQLLFCCVWSVTSMATIKPVFNKTPVNVTFYRGETATLPCSVSNLGSSSVVWKRIDEPHVLTVGEFAFVSDPKFSVKYIPFRDEWNLIIDHVEPKHSGRYECQISTKDDIVRYVDLNVITSIHYDKKYRKIMKNINSFNRNERLNKINRIQQGLNDEPGHDSKHVNIDGPHLVEKGHPIRLTCNASGNSRSPTAINWYIGGKRLYDGLNHNVRIITYPRSDVNTLYSELRITKSDTEDSGTYVCQTTFYNDILKVAKHNLSVIIADSNQTKRGTMADGSVNSVKDNRRPSSRNTENTSRRLEIAFMPYLFTFLVAWCFAQ